MDVSTELREGIRLTSTQAKIIDCLTKLLHKKSETSDPGKDNYYTGNMQYELMAYGQNKEMTKVPKLGVTLYELAKEYKGGDSVLSGKDLRTVGQALTELSNRKHLLKYEEISHKRKGGKITNSIETYASLIQLYKFTRKETNEFDVEVSKREEIVILLHPIFQRQIKDKFILLPDNYLQLTIDAYGSQKIPSSVFRLRDYLAREYSAKRYKREITKEKLLYLVAEEYMEKSRKTKALEEMERAIETVKNMGLLSSVEISTSSKGEQKYIFHLNKNWME